MNKSKITKLSNRICRIADSVIALTTESLKKRLIDNTRNLIETIDDIIKEKIKTAAPVPEAPENHKIVLERYFNLSDAVVSLGRTQLSLIDQAIQETTDPNFLYNASIQVRDKIIVLLKKINVYDVYAHSIAEHKKVRELKNDLLNLKKSFDRIVFSLK